MPCYRVPVSTVNLKFDYPWPLLRVIVEGTSILDIPKLELKNMEEATKFVEAYGFEPSDSNDQELMWGATHKAFSNHDRVVFGGFCIGRRQILRSLYLANSNT